MNPTRTIIRTPNRSTLPPDPVESLFIYLVEYNNPVLVGGVMKTTRMFYSYDRPEERACFQPGLTREAKAIWRGIFANAITWSETAFQFLAQAYPVFLTPKQMQEKYNETDPEGRQAVELLYHPTKIAEAAIELFAENHEAVVARFRQAGLLLLGFTPKKDTKAPLGLSPLHADNLAAYNGLCAGKTYMLKSHSDIRRIAVFDNRATHPHNKIEVWHPAPADAYVVPPIDPEPPRRAVGQPHEATTASDLISNFFNSRKA